jgi:hypothetical protein
MITSPLTGRITESRPQPRLVAASIDLSLAE